jgi:hypothetical protein
MFNSNTLTEIKKGQVGTGLLVESDGYVSLDIKDNRQLCESIEKEEGYLINLPRPFVVNAVFQKYGVENANGRIYPEDVLKREVEKYQKLIADRRALGQLNHPEDSNIDLERIAINVVELHWENKTLVGKIEIPITEGFRRYGIISCLADQTAHLLLSGLKIGVSSRALGSVKQVGGVLVVNSDLEILCWDVVGSPSTVNAWISDTYEGLEPYKESVEKDDSKLIKEDKYSKFDNWLNG